MLQAIRQNNSLQPFIVQDCVENGISLSISSHIPHTDYVIIKVDSYYNSLGIVVPPSPDCLIILKCADGQYVAYIVELKDIQDSQGFTVDNIKSKFITCLDDFMLNRFGNIFYTSQDIIKMIKLFFISDPYGYRENPDKQLKMRGHKLDLLMAIRFPKYFNLHLYIEYHVPNPTLNPCQ